MPRRPEPTDGLLAELAAGVAAPPTIAALRTSRYTRTLLLLRQVCRHWPGPVHHRDAAVDLLGAAQARAPEVVTDLLSDPHAGAWATWLGRRLRGSYDPGSPIESDLAYLSGLAAVAAHRTGVEGELPVLSGPDGVFLPTLGRLCGPAGEVTIQLRKGTIAVDDTDIDIDGRYFLAQRRLTVGPESRRFSVLLDDLDPYRGRYDRPAADRLPRAEVGRWHENLDAAWALLVDHDPARADELAAGVRALVPLVPDAGGLDNSATSMDAFGAMGLTAPSAPVELALTLVHEFQHSKLGALMDVVPLHDPADPGRYFAPWRRDPRPIGGLLQGIYAFLAIAETWHRLSVVPRLEDAGLRGLAEVREQTAAALDSLAGTAALTPAGHRFVAGLRSTLDRLRALAVPPHVSAQASAALRENRTEWERRNGRSAIPERRTATDSGW